VSLSVEEVLRTALDDELHARATYRAVIDAFGEVRPFIHIVESEERHIQALRRLFERYGVDVPADRWAGKVAAPASLEAACQAAVEAERENAALYARLIESEAGAGRRDVEETLRRLQAASQQNHLPAFERALERERGGSGDRVRGGTGSSEATDGPRRRRRRHRGGGSAGSPGGGCGRS
jgi:hypothetical protein